MMHHSTAAKQDRKGAGCVNAPPVHEAGVQAMLSAARSAEQSIKVTCGCQRWHTTRRDACRASQLIDPERSLRSAPAQAQLPAGDADEELSMGNSRSMGACISRARTDRLIAVRAIHLGEFCRAATPVG